MEISHLIYEWFPTLVHLKRFQKTLLQKIFVLLDYVFCFRAWIITSFSVLRRFAQSAGAMSSSKVPFLKPSFGVYVTLDNIVTIHEEKKCLHLI